MRQLAVTRLGTDPEITEVDKPTPGPDQMLLRIEACGLNFADLLMIKGEYQEKPPLPFAPGMEVAGVVEALGPGTSGPALGSRVAVVGGSGGLADYGCFPAARAVTLPETMDSVTAAGFQVAYGTSHLALSRRARLKKDETLLVLGAAGGVGLTAVEIGKALGARVIAVARGAEKLAVAEAAGADHLIDAEDDLRTAVKALGGADVVYDPVGGPAFDAALRVLKPEGRIIVIGFASGTIPQIPANLLLVKNIDVVGFYWGGMMAFAPEAVAASLAELFALHAEGRLKPHIGHVLPPEKIGEGLDLIRSRRSTGKVVIRFS